MTTPSVYTDAKRQQIEKTLQETDVIFRLLTENTRDVIWTMDLDGHFTYVSPSVFKLRGYTVEEVMQQSIQEAFSSDSAIQALAGIQVLLAQEETKDVHTNWELQQPCKDGRIVWTEVSTNIIRDKQGSAYAVLGVSRDITERKIAEGVIAEQAHLLNVALDPIILRDMNDVLIFWNKAAENLYGWTFDEAKSLKVNQFITEVDQPKYERGVKEFLEKGECKIELQQRAKNGRKIITLSHWSLVRNQDGNPYARLVIDRDITEQRYFETQLRRSQRMESLGTLAGGIAHDLNNVLAPILMSIQILNLKITDSNLKKLIASLEASTKRGSDVIKQISTFARGTEKNFAPQQLRYSMTEIESMINGTFPKNIQLRIGASKDLSLILGDAVQLQQMLMNLCLNARDAMPDGGRLTVTAEDMYMDESYAHMILGAHPGQYVVLTVADTGTGIPMEIQEKVFEPFFSTKEKGKYSGLGLSMVYAIVKSHNSFIKLYSEIGKGTEIKIFLPVTQQVEKKIIPVYEDIPSMGNGENILVVDDELSVLEISKEILEARSYRVLTAADGAEATAIFASAEKGSINLVITDMNMPLMDGSSTIRALRRLDPNLKIVVSSGLLTNVNSAGVAGLDIQGYLTKPYTADQLASMVNKVLRKEYHPESGKSS
jgi:two-component system, cell cycle sensor histidine kinase and response regulator CckA